MKPNILHEVPTALNDKDLLGTFVPVDFKVDSCWFE